ncbi:hypothetical protein ARMSODRAFT_980535 [Armillaria solidipes]|uniref:Uncharacterized protein n=1 Tax=Armillaria solidipes TaxID=1076256 RepID=A0A2H3B1A7_9AGAR|nr:hypothetical protein ARMSODRAFT_980535 [Armillaria solidipes]
MAFWHEGEHTSRLFKDLDMKCSTVEADGMAPKTLPFQQNVSRCFSLSLECAIQSLQMLNGNYILETGSDMLLSQDGREKFNQFKVEYTKGTNAGLEMFLLWESRLKFFFQCMDKVFESQVKEWLKEEDWALLIVCHMGFSAYAHLQHGMALGVAILTSWAIFPVPVEIPYQGHDNNGACRACLICGDNCLPPSPSELYLFKLTNHVELLFASNAIINFKFYPIASMGSIRCPMILLPLPLMSSSSVTGPVPLPSRVLCGHAPLLFRVHANLLSVEDIMAIGIQAKHYMQYRWDFTITWDTVAHAEIIVLKLKANGLQERLLASLDKLGQWSCA